MPANDTLKPSGARVEVVGLNAWKVHRALASASRPRPQVARSLTLGVSRMHGHSERCALSRRVVPLIAVSLSACGTSRPPEAVDSAQSVRAVVTAAPAPARPERVVWLDGVMLPETDHGEFSVSRAQTSRGPELWLRRVLERRSGRPVWEDLAWMPLPELEDDELLVLSNCRRDGVFDPELMAVAKYEDAEEYRDVRRVWRADRQARAFREISSAGVVCINEGYGA